MVVNGTPWYGFFLNNGKHDHAGGNLGITFPAIRTFHSPSDVVNRCALHRALPFWLHSITNCTSLAFCGTKNFLCWRVVVLCISVGSRNKVRHHWWPNLCHTILGSVMSNEAFHQTGAPPCAPRLSIYFSAPLQIAKDRLVQYKSYLFEACRHNKYLPRFHGVWLHYNVGVESSRSYFCSLWGYRRIKRLTVWCGHS